MKSCVTYRTKTISPGSPSVATARLAPKICKVQPPTIYSECSRFHPDRFTYGGVIAKCVNTAKTRRYSNIRLKPSFEPNNQCITVTDYQGRNSNISGLIIWYVNGSICASIHELFVHQLVVRFMSTVVLQGPGAWQSPT